LDREEPSREAGAVGMPMPLRGLTGDSFGA